jgi:hypothetical protein
MHRASPSLLLAALTLLLAACGGRAPAPAAAPVEETQPPMQAEAPPADREDVSAWASPLVPDIEPFPGTTGISAARCADCHAEIAAEWAASTHAHAWVDPQFQAELHKDPEVGWICLNCHTPLQAQQPERITYSGSVRAAARAPNPTLDTTLRDEGITCLTCHYRPEGIAAVHEDVAAPHPTVYAPELREAETCTRCHEAQAQVEATLVCTFSTGTEWTEAAPGRTCPDCHMQRVVRSHATGAPEREGGRHLWPGSLLPKDPWSETEAAMFAGWAPGTDARLELRAPVAPGEQTTATLHVQNTRAGHKLPTGDPERHYVLTLRARDATGALLAEETKRIGQVWEWWPEARRLADERIPAGGTVSMPIQWTQGPTPVSVEATVEHVRISDENAAYHDLGSYPRRRVVHEERAVVAPATAPR